MSLQVVFRGNKLVLVLVLINYDLLSLMEYLFYKQLATCLTKKGYNPSQERTNIDLIKTF